MPALLDPSPALAAARDSAVVCDLGPCAILAVDGDDAATFLQGQLSSDIVGLAADACVYTSYNSPAGRVLANMLIWRSGPAAADGFHALLSADCADFARKRLAMFVMRSKVTLADASTTLSRFGVGGPRGRDAVRAALGDAPAPFALVRNEGAVVLAVPGPRYIVVAPTANDPTTFDALAREARPASFDVWRWLTIRSGVAVISEATRDKFIPQMINWDVLRGIHFQKGCYTGQEIIARTQYLGRLKERLFAFTSSGVGANAGDRLYSHIFGEQPCGTVVNAAPAPQGGEALLAVVQLAAAASGEVRLGRVDGPVLSQMNLPYPVPELDAHRGLTV